MRALEDTRPQQSLLRVFLVTFCMVGIQFTWTVELAYGTPYLLSLELSREVTALVWLAGPLSGLIVQPLIGAVSDRTTAKLGRRRPFIIGGGVLVCAAMLCVAYAKEIANVLVGSSGSETDALDTKWVTKLVAVTAFYVLDFALNAVQASCRSLILDVFPMAQQDTANAFASNMGNVTNVFGYFIGYIDLVKYFPFLGDSQMKAFCVGGILIFIFAMTVASLSAKEIPLRQDQLEQKSSWDQSIRYIIQTLRHLPNPIQRLCNVQFFAWMGWFPFLFYSTTWVSAIYFKTHEMTSPDSWAEGTRAGSRALLLYAVVSVIAGTVLPSLTTRHIVSLKNTYTFAHTVFAVAMLSTPLIETVTGATIVLGALGITWACTMWIPFALIGEYLVVMKGYDDPEETETITDNYGATHGALHAESSDAVQVVGESDSKTHKDIPEAGMVLGVLNLYVVLPQFVVALISACIFAAFSFTPPSEGDDTPQQNATPVTLVLMFGGLMAIIAAVLSRRVLDVNQVRNIKLH